MSFLDDAGALIPLLAMGGILSKAGGGRSRRSSSPGLLTRLMDESAKEQAWRREQEALKKQQEMALYGDLARLSVEQGFSIPDELASGMSRLGIDAAPLQALASQAYHKSVGPEFDRFASVGHSAPEDLLAATSWQDLNRIRQQYGDTAYRDAVMSKVALGHAADPNALRAMGALPAEERQSAPGKIHGDPGGFLSSLMSGYGAESARDYGQKLGLLDREVGGRRALAELEGRQRMEAIAATNQGRLDAYDKELEMKKALAGLGAGQGLTDEERRIALSKEQGKIIADLEKGAQERLKADREAYRAMVENLPLGAEAPPEPDWSLRELDHFRDGIRLYSQVYPHLDLPEIVAPYLEEKLSGRASGPAPEETEEEGYTPSSEAEMVAGRYLRGDREAVKLFESRGVSRPMIVKAQEIFQAEHGRKPTEEEIVAFVYDEVINKR